MTQIAIDFLRGPDLSSQLIAWFGQGADGYSHCASVLSDGRYLDARSDNLLKVPSGVHIRDPKSEKWIKKRRATLEVTQTEYDDWDANLRAKITDDYGRGDIEGFILGRDTHQAGHWICSALAINAVQHISRSWKPGHLGYIPFPLVVPAHGITPNVALLLVQTAGFTIGNVEIPTP